jgi:hypothetical protein
MPQNLPTVVKAKDGRFFKIPDSVLEQYLVKPDKLSASEKGYTNGHANGHTNGGARGTVQVIINVSPEGHVQTTTAKPESSNAQWIYEAPTAGPAMEWGDDIDPTGGMSSAARRG